MGTEPDPRALGDEIRERVLSDPRLVREALVQKNLTYAGLIAIGLVIVQAFLTAPSLDLTAKISVIAFAVAIPLLAALLLVNRQEAFRGRSSPSVLVLIADSVAETAALAGVVAAFWHLHWVAGVAMLGSGVVAIGVHSAGWWRLEKDQGLAQQ